MYSLNQISYKFSTPKNALIARISEYVLDLQSNPNFKFILKKGKPIDEEEFPEKKKHNVDHSLEEGEIENNNVNNDAASSHSSSSNSSSSESESDESYNDTSKKIPVHFDGK